MSDYVVRVQTKDGFARAFCGIFTETVDEARRVHGLGAQAADLLGRALMGASMMGLMLKHEDDLLTVRLSGDGPLGGVLATSGADGLPKGYVFNPDADIPTGEGGRTSGLAAFGQGELTVIKDLGLKEPYQGRIQLVSGEVAEDLAMYFTQSEQTPTAVALGVSFNDNGVKAAGGFIIQLMPGAPDPLAAYIQNCVVSLPSISSMIAESKTPEDILNEAFGGFETEALARHEIRYRCDCCRERVESALLSVNIRELRKMRDEDGRAEICCHFCKENYLFSKDDLSGLINERIEAFAKGLKEIGGS